MAPPGCASTSSVVELGDLAYVADGASPTGCASGLRIRPRVDVSEVVGPRLSPVA